MELRDPADQDNLLCPHHPHVLQQEAEEQAAAADGRRDAADIRDAIQ